MRPWIWSPELTIKSQVCRGMLIIPEPKSRRWIDLWASCTASQIESMCQWDTLSRRQAMTPQVHLLSSTHVCVNQTYFILNSRVWEVSQGLKCFENFHYVHKQRKKKVYYEKDPHINIRRMSTFPLAVYPLVGQWDPTTVCSLSWGNGKVEEVGGLSILSYQCTASTPGGILPFIVNMNSYWNWNKGRTWT